MGGIKVTLGRYGRFQGHIREEWEVSRSHWEGMGGVKVILKRYGRYQDHIRKVWKVSRSH